LACVCYSLRADIDPMLYCYVMYYFARAHCDTQWCISLLWRL